MRIDTDYSEQLIAEMRDQCAIAAKGLAGEDFADLDASHSFRQQRIQTAGRERDGCIRNVLKGLQFVGAFVGGIIDFLRRLRLLFSQ